MTVEALRHRISEIDVLYSKIDDVELKYGANMLLYIDYMIKKTKLEEQINKLFNVT